MLSRALLILAVLLIAAGPPMANLAPGGWFIDDDGNVHEGYIEAISAGITRSCNPPVNYRYCPTATVTRGQMAAFLVRALVLPATPRSCRCPGMSLLGRALSARSWLIRHSQG